jgi:hypothetical protein
MMAYYHIFIGPHVISYAVIRVIVILCYLKMKHKNNINIKKRNDQYSVFIFCNTYFFVYYTLQNLTSVKLLL